MSETWLFFVEILKLIVLFTMVLAPFAWKPHCDRGDSVFLRVSMIISVYGI
ncbi:hypothetical protein EKD04_022565 [Chloroflexales bacterium ZM16-3]|nr:hypothetical protein [Chloroflexales bacterium ZM16-3]